MDKFYQHSLPQPFHLSVGAVLFNEQGKICVHHFFAEKIPEHQRFAAGGLPEFYYLMRESLEGDESLQTAVHRGLKEEFGAEGTIEKYLGSTVYEIVTPMKKFEKTTVYHAVRLKELGPREIYDEESETVMEWHEPRELLALFREQAQKTDRPELNETSIIERFIAIYG